MVLGVMWMDAVSGAMIVAAGGAGGLAFAVGVFLLYLILTFYRRSGVFSAQYDRSHIVLRRPQDRTLVYGDSFRV